MREIKKIFNEKRTENGDIAYTNFSDNNLANILFKTSYLRGNLDKVKIGNSPKEQLFSMFIRDPRYGLGERDLGRELMEQSGVSPEQVVRVGRFDDLLYMSEAHVDFLIEEVKDGNQLAKKWMPRLTSGKTSRKLARYLVKKMGVSEKQYRNLLSDCKTVEKTLSENKIVEDYSKIPSLAFNKYIDCFRRKDEKGFSKFMESLKKGDTSVNVSTTDVFQIGRLFEKTPDNAELCNELFKALDHVPLGSIIPIIDNSGSMYDGSASYLKARTVGHYVAKNSNYLQNHVISFSSYPKLIELGSNYEEDMEKLNSFDDISCTNFGKVMQLLSKLESDFPDYLLVLSDMEFDCGSSQSKEETMRLFKEKGASTKIVWWNFNSRNETCPETDEYGNIFLSGYNPTILSLLKLNFDNEAFLNALLEDYAKKINWIE